MLMPRSLDALNPRLERDKVRLIFLTRCPGRSAARVLRVGVYSTLHGVVFAIFVQALPCTAEGTQCRLWDTEISESIQLQTSCSNRCWMP
jgi:hypothetical protein